MTIHPHRVRCSRAAASLFVLTCAALPAHAQASVELTEVEFLRTLDSTHPVVVSLTGDLARAEADRKRAGAFANPTFEFEREAPSDLPEQTTLKLGWQPPLDGRRGVAIDATEAAVVAAQHDLEWATLQVRQILREVFADWAVAAQRRALLVRHFESLRPLEERLNVRAERGEESLLAARRFALAVSLVRGELARAEADLAQLRGQAMALREDLPDDATPVLPALPAVPATLEDSSRPDLLARRSEVEAAALRHRLAGRFLAFPTLVAGWTRITDAGSDFDGPYLGLTWDVPLFDRHQGDRHEFVRAIEIAGARLRLLEREGEQRRSAAWEAYRALHTSLAEIESVVEAAPTVVDAASAAFLAGESNMTDLLETLDSVLESQLAALDLTARALAAHRELELSAGRALTLGDAR